MPRYSYTATDFRNRKTKGAADARDADDLKRILRGKDLVPLKYKELAEKHTSYRLSANEAAEFSRQLSSMLGSGITIVRALEILMGRDFKEPIRLIYEKLFKDVQQGYTLSEAMRLQPKAFPELLVNMCASGEASGQLEQVARKMAAHYEKEYRLNGKVRTAMTYPMILLIVTIGVVIIIFTAVLPKFFLMFNQNNLEIPALTNVMIVISDFLLSSWYWVIIAALSLAALFQYLSTIHKVAVKLDYAKLKIPVIGKLLKTIYTARFARALSSLYSSGISIINALLITSTIIGNKYIEGQFEGVIKDVRNGEALSASVGKIEGFDSKLATTILIGEESGRLDTMLESTAESFDYEAEIATGQMVQYVEPVMLVTMAVIVGTILLSVMSPLISLYNQVGSM